MSRTYVVRVKFNQEKVTFYDDALSEMKNNLIVGVPSVVEVDVYFNENTLVFEVNLPELAKDDMIEYFKHLLSQIHTIDYSAYIEINDKYTEEEFKREYPIRGKYLWELVYRTIHSDLSVENDCRYKFYFGDEVKYIIQSKSIGEFRFDYYVTDCGKVITTKLDAKNGKEAIKLVEKMYLDKLIGDFNKLHDAVNNKVAELTEYSKAMAGLI